MDLNYGPKYKNFRDEVKKFCKEYSGVHLESSKVPLSDRSKSGEIKMKDRIGKNFHRKRLFC
jgi:hypothetical protein